MMSESESHGYKDSDNVKFAVGASWSQRCCGTAPVRMCTECLGAASVAASPLSPGNWVHQVCVCVYACICIHICVLGASGMCMRVCVCECMYAFIYGYTNLSKHAWRTCTHEYLHTYIHTHTHTNIVSKKEAYMW
jgi:hypothetical protein